LKLVALQPRTLLANNARAASDAASGFVTTRNRVRRRIILGQSWIKTAFAVFCIISRMFCTIHDFLGFGPVNPKNQVCKGFCRVLPGSAGFCKGSRAGD